MPQKKNITIVNSPNPICGVGVFGKRIYGFLSELGRNNYTYTTGGLPEEKPDIVIFNWHLATMPNLKRENIERLKSYEIKVGIIPHNKNHDSLDCFDFVLHDDCCFKDNKKEIGLPRVIIPFSPKIKPILNSVGFFGFLFPHKNLEGLAEKIDKEYGSNGILRIKSTPYPGYEKYFDLVIDWVRKNTNVQLDINTNFLDENGIVDWLSHNEINAFPYIHHPDSQGQTTVIDFALASKRPICISDSKLFDHIRHIKNISFERNTFSEIIKQGITPFDELYNNWTKEKLVDKVEDFLEFI